MRGILAALFVLGCGDDTLATSPDAPEPFLLVDRVAGARTLKSGDAVPEWTGGWPAIAKPALQDASGGPWAGSVYDAGRILRLLEAGRRALGE